MPTLAPYHRKRDFQHTPEPRGEAAAAATEGPRFVVQKHAARRLHYDLRLEHDGVLKSWAVPKGPSLDPATKTLAVQVEDHPLQYASFEGVIPQGQYGGGTVMLWDRGTWRPHGEVDAGLRRGRLRFELRGQRLRGSWSLVRMKPKRADAGDAGDERNWLLIKSDDEHARPGAGRALVEAHVTSIASGRTMQQIAADRDAIRASDPPPDEPDDAPPAATDEPPPAETAASTGAFAERLAALPGVRPAAPPRTVRPQLATLVNDVPTGETWLHEIKLDGYRIIARRNGERTTLATRNGKDWTQRFPAIAGAVSRLPVAAAVLDGEVVILRQDGTSDFQALQNALNEGAADQALYFAFDLLYLDGCDLQRVPLHERKALLRDVLQSGRQDAEARVRYSDHIRGRGEAVFRNACRLGLEGVISKRADAAYEPRRSRSWLKIKCHRRQAFVIGGYTDPKGARTAFGALLLGYHNDAGELVYCGRVGTGFTENVLRRLHEHLQPLMRDDPPFINPPAGREAADVHWVRPQLVAEVQFTGWTRDAVLRHPSFLGLRHDKPPHAITREEPQPMQAITPNGDDAPAHGQPSPGAGDTGDQPQPRRTRRPRRGSATEQQTTIAGVRLSNPDRVMYPEQGLTKRDLAAYYLHVADRILPHLIHRPLAVVRCPQGHARTCFFQKHMNESIPEHVKGAEIEESDGGVATYLMIDDLAGLIALVQLGVLEFHPWGSRDDRPDRPDVLVFDLDPGPDVSWQDVKDAALAVRNLLDEVDLETFVRTSGGKGLHVVVPITRRTGWDDAKQFARGVAETLARREPTRYTATMSKARRRGKVFIDYLRNGRGATAVCSYSTRARPGAPVATPLRWDELPALAAADAYRVDNLPQRLAALDRDPWSGFLRIRQSITAAARRRVGAT